MSVKILVLFLGLTLPLLGQVSPDSKDPSVSILVDGDALAAIKAMRRKIALAKPDEVPALEQSLVVALVRQGMITEARSLAAKLVADKGPTSEWAKRWLAAIGNPVDSGQSDNPLMSILRVLESKSSSSAAVNRASDLLEDLSAASDRDLANAIAKLSPMGTKTVLDVISMRLDRPTFAPLILALCQSSDPIKRHSGISKINKLKFDSLWIGLPALLDHKDPAVVEATLSKLQDTKKYWRSRLIEHKALIFKAAKRLAASSNDDWRDDGIEALEYDFFVDDKAVDDVLENVIRATGREEPNQDAIRLWLKRRRTFDPESFSRVFEASTLETKEVMLGIINQRDKYSSMVVRSSLKDPNLQFGAYTAALKLGIPVPDALLLKYFTETRDIRLKLGKIQRAKQEIGDELAAAIVDNLLALDKTGLPTVGLYTRRVRVLPNPNHMMPDRFHKLMGEHLDFLAQWNPAALGVHAHKILRTQARYHLKNHTSSTKNASLCHALTNMIIESQFTRKDSALYFDWVLQTCEPSNFLDLALLAQVRAPSPYRQSSYDKIMKGIESILKPEHLEIYLNAIAGKKHAFPGYCHESIMKLFQATDLDNERQMNLIKEFVATNATNKKLIGSMTAIVRAIPISQREYLTELISKYDGPIESGAFEAMLNACDTDSARRNLFLKYLAEPECLTAIKLLQNPAIKDDARVQLRGFARWVALKQDKKFGHFSGDWKLIPRNKCLAAIVEAFGLGNYYQCEVIMKAIDLTQADDKALLPVYANVLDYSKTVPTDLRYQVIQRLGWYFEVDGLEILIEGLRDTHAQNAKSAKDGVERVRLYLEGVAEIRELKRTLGADEKVK